MKNTIYKLLIFGTVLMFSCKKNITDLNTNPTRPETVTSSALFSNASINLSDVLASTNVNNNNFRLFVQYWTETIYRDETRYNLNQRSIPDRWWATFYRDVIKDLTEASAVADGETATLSAAEIQNRKAINEILIVYAYYHLLTSFGNIPYEEALNIENPQPAYDDAATVYGKILTRLNDATAQLDNTAAAYGSADLILDGDVDRWILFANCLKMKMGMTIVDVNPGTATTLITTAAPNVIMSNQDNIKINYLAAPPNTNPVWEDLVQSGRHDFVAAQPFIDTLKELNDPRLSLFFDTTITVDPATRRTLGYLGQSPGLSAVFNNFSAPSKTVAAADFPHTFFSYAEMEFYKAEAVERGIAVGGTAMEHYNNAVTASIMEWGGTAADAATYLAQPSVNYSTAQGGYKEKIGLQSWIALYNRGFDAWTQWRRLDYPVLNVPNLGATNPYEDGETPSVIKRLSYPVVEQNLNKTNYNNAVSAMGNDQITLKLWFDKF